MKTRYGRLRQCVKTTSHVVWICNYMPGASRCLAHFFLFFETGGKAEPVARKTQGALVDEAPVLQSWRWSVKTICCDVTCSGRSTVAPYSLSIALVPFSHNGATWRGRCAFCISTKAYDEGRVGSIAGGELAGHSKQDVVTWEMLVAVKSKIPDPLQWCDTLNR